MLILIEIFFALSLMLIIYHLFLYPRLLRYFSANRNKPGLPAPNETHHFIFLIPMHNEEAFIVEKINNLAAIDYPVDKFEVLLLDDGSTDHSSRVALEAIKQHQNITIKITSYPTNRGKVAIFNEIIPTIPDHYILFFSDVSALLSPNVLSRANAYFNDSTVGVYGAKYLLHQNSLNGEKAYWRYQADIKCLESLLGTPIGFHGTGYAIRKSLWAPLPVTTINDDFVMPMQVINKGYTGVYDDLSSGSELELSSPRLDWNRRLRIAKGNIQQVYFLLGLLSPKQGFIAWMFWSSKVLRVFLPWFFIILFISSLPLAYYFPLIFLPIVLVQIGIFLFALINTLHPIKIKEAEIMTYFINGQIAMLMGWFSIHKLTGNWQRAKLIHKSSFIHPIVRILKWIFDKIGAVIGLLILILLFPMIALGIKLSSPGPIFYKQLRVGKGNAKGTKLFCIYKLRTMCIHEDSSGPSWTQKNDPRVFSFGAFLRKTHLDELPQFYNVLKGDMSIIGPRPERPSLYSYIEENIPFYAERLYGILPGITGYAQISLGPDRVIDDVKNKVSYDHAYAMHLTKPWSWLKLELYILYKTIVLVFRGKEI